MLHGILKQKVPDFPWNVFVFSVKTVRNSGKHDEIIFPVYPQMNSAPENPKIPHFFLCPNIKNWNVQPEKQTQQPEPPQLADSKKTFFIKQTTKTKTTIVKH